MTRAVMGGTRRWKLSSLDRFLDKLEVVGDCLQWTASKTGYGYPIFFFNGGHVAGHRWSYEQFVGPIPEGLVIDHLCRNPGCVAPDHLGAVTQRVNILRGTAPPARCARVTECPQGHPYDEANTARGSKGERRCRECKAIENRRWREAQRAASQK